MKCGPDDNCSVAVFVDASNVWEAQKAKGKFFDYEKLKSCIQQTYDCQNVQVYYYTAYPADGTREYNLDSKHKFFTYLKKGLGFVVRKKPLKRIKTSTEEGQAVVEKGNMDVEMTIDAMHYRNTYKTAIFFSGDADFVELVNYLQRDGKKVYIYSSRNNVSTEMRTSGDGYVDILKLSEDIWGRDLAHRKSKKNK